MGATRLEKVSPRTYKTRSAMREDRRRGIAGCPYMTGSPEESRGSGCADFFMGPVIHRFGKAVSTRSSTGARGFLHVRSPGFCAEGAGRP